MSQIQRTIPPEPGRNFRLVADELFCDDEATGPLPVPPPSNVCSDTLAECEATYNPCGGAASCQLTVGGRYCLVQNATVCGNPSAPSAGFPCYDESCSYTQRCVPGECALHGSCAELCYERFPYLTPEPTPSPTPPSPTPSLTPSTCCPPAASGPYSWRKETTEWWYITSWTYQAGPTTYVDASGFPHLFPLSDVYVARAGGSSPNTGPVLIGLHDEDTNPVMSCRFPIDDFPNTDMPTAAWYSFGETSCQYYQGFIPAEHGILYCDPNACP